MGRSLHATHLKLRIQISELFCFCGGWGFVLGSPKLPSGKLPRNYGKSPFLMGKSTISMAIFNSYATNYQRAVGGVITQVFSMYKK